ncbi:MAG: hypothetical protein CVU42_05165 [Chloroflexi bacterium HGW-Chloroflexi-4]|jgi:hypothetical protein|nr:MAG: hypothetical protein CVU42_05165 [Chloroflexi bacterium HGW-Chloroflexi-4]
MYQSLYEFDYRKSQYHQYQSGLPAEFKDLTLVIPYTSQSWTSRLMLALAEQMIKTGQAIKSTQVKLNKQENY